MAKNTKSHSGAFGIMIETPMPAPAPRFASPFAARFTWLFNSAKLTTRSSNRM
ncbi:MAG: hypothetical protein M5U18_05005 [Dehalococcoidia bacterium]|nr:hypothetical protein [Dehalococcoidia bacterium]